MVTIDQIILGLGILIFLLAGFEEKRKLNKSKVTKKSNIDFISFKIV